MSFKNIRKYLGKNKNIVDIKDFDFEEIYNLTGCSSMHKYWNNYSCLMQFHLPSETIICKHFSDDLSCLNLALLFSKKIPKHLQ